MKKKIQQSSSLSLFDWIKQNVDFDQLINEHDFTWVHVSYHLNKNRKQILVIK